MRLRRSQREQAKEELLAILSHGACRTSDLRGTQKFHGSRTLSFYQIRALLRETGKVPRVARRPRNADILLLDARNVDSIRPPLRCQRFTHCWHPQKVKVTHDRAASYWNARDARDKSGSLYPSLQWSRTKKTALGGPFPDYQSRQVAIMPEC